TEAEYRLMAVLWERGESTVADVVEAIVDPPLAYNTVLTTLRILEQKGYLRHKAVGRAFVYQPVVARDEAQRTVVRHVLSRFFDGSPRELVLNLLESEAVDERELDRLRELLDRAKEK
ncbi:MAG: BlaI/MecI/CopY family transcriptional regulator, partial [Candidatus Eremiobacteraeota bacterium]|nr:BlaI/MecI/CopY family transcriptional regulator [Candidatus Eremiobacteraeota bacterium]